MTMPVHPTPVDRSVVPDEVREAALSEFVSTWVTYPSATAAAQAISARFGVGRTTLVDWAKAQGTWPRTRASVAGQLEAENKALREENARLRHQLGHH